MVNIIRADDKAEYELIKRLKERGVSDSRKVGDIVTAILENVRNEGDEAVQRYTAAFDCPNAEYYEVPREVIEKALSECEPEFVSSLTKAAENIRAYHEKQKQNSWMETKENGIMMGQRVRGMTRVGVYVPGGTAPLFSSVLMNAIPARVAGVKEIIMLTPPMKNGKPNQYILAAAAVAGVDRVFLAGGAQAIAALAYGTQQIPQVDKIVGPGNVYVATAKRMVFGTVDIDMIAGPSEIMIVADETADPAFLAADMMSQAEHDVLASSVLLTTSEQLAKDTDVQLYAQSRELDRRDFIAKSLEDYGAVILVDTIDQAIDLANELAPEHLELCIENPVSYIGRVDNAGSVFLGNYSPEPLGDYFAGPNHVLPTNGTARFSSPLSVDSFVKKSSFLYYPQAELAKIKDDVIRLADAESLTAHANSVAVRFK